MTAIELLAPGEARPDNPRWHELRRAGVTASEVAVVMGLSPYDSPFNLYWSKTNDWRWGGNEYTGVGSHLEDAIADWWLIEHGAPMDLTTMHAGLYAHPDRPWQLATPDRIVIDVWGTDVALLECKWVAQSWDGWGEEGTDDIPVYYRCQGLWQADTLGVDEVHFAVLGPTGFRAYLVRRDERGEADLVLMRAAALDFVRRIRESDPPPLDSHSATVGALKRLYPSVGTGEVEVSAELAVKYRVARAAKKVAEERIAECEAEIRYLLEEDCGRAVQGGQTVALRSVFGQRRIDSTRLRKEQPEIADAYTSVTTVDKLTPGRAKP